MKSVTVNIIAWLLSSAVISCNSRPIESRIAGQDSMTVPIELNIGSLSREVKTMHGQYVMVKGKFFYGFEDVALYDDDIFPNDDMRFWLDFDSAIDVKVLKKVSGDVVILKGKVDTSRKGHLNGYLATIRDIYYIKKD